MQFHKYGSIVVIGVVTTMVTGCATTTTIVPMTNQGAPLPEARILVGGAPRGQGATELNADDPVDVTVEAGPEWISERLTIDEDSPEVIEVALRPDNLYRATVFDQNLVVNRWLTMSISEAVQPERQWWSSIVAALAGRDFEMEMMDAQSGFVRSAWMMRGFDRLEVRRRFVGNIVNNQPLQWRIRYEVHVREPGSSNWTPYERGFSEDLDAINEIRSRIE